MTQTTLITCACGQVHLEVEEAPIVSAECHCNSCRQAGAKLQSLPGAPSFLETNGGTRFVLYRKDRVHFTKGDELLKEFRLTPKSKTRRVVATCLQHAGVSRLPERPLLSLYACLWPQDKLPPLDLRTMTSDLPDSSVLSDNLPNAKWQSSRSLPGFSARGSRWVSRSRRSLPSTERFASDASDVTGLTFRRRAASVALDHALAAGRFQAGAKLHGLVAGERPHHGAVERALSGNLGFVDRSCSRSENPRILALQGLERCPGVSLGLLRRDLYVGAAPAGRSNRWIDRRDLGARFGWGPPAATGIPAHWPLARLWTRYWPEPACVVRVPGRAEPVLTGLVLRSRKHRPDPAGC